MKCKSCGADLSQPESVLVLCKVEACMQGRLLHLHHANVNLDTIGDESIECRECGELMRMPVRFLGESDIVLDPPLELMGCKIDLITADRYVNGGGLSVSLWCDNGEPWTTLSVNRDTAPPEGWFWLHNTDPGQPETIKALEERGLLQVDYRHEHPLGRLKGSDTKAVPVTQKELLEIVTRARAAIETPGDLEGEEREHIIEDLELARKALIEYGFPQV